MAVPAQQGRLAPGGCSVYTPGHVHCTGDQLLFADLFPAQVYCMMLSCYGLSLHTVRAHYHRTRSRAKQQPDLSHGGQGTAHGWTQK